MSNDTIQCHGQHRGVGLHRGQCERRLTVVRREIDAVYELKAVDGLMAFASDAKRAPEARLFAGATLEAMFESAAENREVRPDIDLVMLRATLAGLDSSNWRDSANYGTLLDSRRGVERDPDDEALIA